MKIDIDNFSSNSNKNKNGYESDESYNPDNYSSNNRRSRRYSDDLTEYKQTNRRKYSELDREYDDKIYKKAKTCDYFRKLNRDKQIDIIDKEEEIYKYFKDDIPLRYKIIYANMPISTKSLILQKIDQHESMSKYDSEFSKLSKWLRGVSLIPFGVYVDIPVNINDSSYKIEGFLNEAHEQLDKTIFGQKEAKNKILQIMAQWISNPNSRGQMIALEGPPGVGKTSLVKQGVAKALKRPFCFYALGGATDASNLEGHSYTYEGATWGRIVEMFMEAKVMNPVVFFDELDKISDTSRGHEISSILTHLTDPSQNTTFYDKYYSEIPFDISRTLFFFSYNNKELINPILKDRLTVIKFDGYEMDDKLKIAMEYVIPELMENQGFKKEDIVWNQDNIKYILQKYCKEEKGVRNLRRCIEDIIMKVNLLRLMNKKEDNLIDSHLKKEIKDNSDLIINDTPLIQNKITKNKNTLKYKNKIIKPLIINKNNNEELNESKQTENDVSQSNLSTENSGKDVQKINSNYLDEIKEKNKTNSNKTNIPYWIDDFKIPCIMDQKLIDIFMKTSSMCKKNEDTTSLNMLYI